ncbi:MAG: type II secretion system GspH family protein [Acidimicrobiia bacterium]|nr:type II secretion system GspH family protein [Acidimicrobiia bacterium]
MRQRTANSGFSLVELLLGLTFMGIVATAIVPFMIRSVANNMSAGETSGVTNVARTTVERYFQADFNDPIVTLSTGKELVTHEYFSTPDKEWKAMPIAGGDKAKWIREITVRQYEIGAVDDGTLTEGEALDATAPASLVALKQVEVFVEGQGAMRALVGEKRKILLTLVKSQ